MRINLILKCFVLKNKVFLPELLLPFKGILPLYYDKDNGANGESGQCGFEPLIEFILKKVTNNR